MEVVSTPAARSAESRGRIPTGRRCRRGSACTRDPPVCAEMRNGV